MGLFVGFALQMAFASSDPAITGDFRLNIQKAMSYHVKTNQIEGKYTLYDSVTGKLLPLNLTELHSGILSKGDFYVSCADFKDTAGNENYIGFMVSGVASDLHVYQALVHKDKQGKRRHHLEN